MNSEKRDKQKDSTTFKEYCKFICKYRSNDMQYAPWQVDFAKDVVADISFPKRTWYRKIENNSDAYKEYKCAIEKYLDKKHACDAAKEAFQTMWNIYMRFAWVEDRYYESRRKLFSC